MGETSIHLECASISTKYIFSNGGLAKLRCNISHDLAGHIHGCRGPLGGQTVTAGTGDKNSHKTRWIYLALATKRTFLRVTSSGIYLDVPIVALEVLHLFVV